MNSVVAEKDMSYYRVRAYAYSGDDIFENFDCVTQPRFYRHYETTDCAVSQGPPTEIRDGEKGSVLVWHDMCVMVDELAANAAVGDLYAVCFCDGHVLGCDSPNRYQTLVQAWKLLGE